MNSSEFGSESAVSMSCRRASKRSEMYFRKTSPKTTCLYSEGSWFPRRASAASQRRCSRVLVTVLDFFGILQFLLTHYMTLPCQHLQGRRDPLSAPSPE